MLFCPGDDGVEEGDDSEGCGEGCVPMMADRAVDSECMLESKIGYCDQHDVDADDDECADRDVGDDGGFNAIEYLATE